MHAPISKMYAFCVYMLCSYLPPMTTRMYMLTLTHGTVKMMHALIILAKLYVQQNACSLMGSMHVQNVSIILVVVPDLSIRQASCIHGSVSYKKPSLHQTLSP